jgi:pheromone shutdown protein TraB
MKKNKNISDITDNKRRQNYILKVLEERDFRFAIKILEVAKENPGKSIIAIMGTAHIRGTKEHLEDKNLQKTFLNI